MLVYPFVLRVVDGFNNALLKQQNITATTQQCHNKTSLLQHNNATLIKNNSHQGIESHLQLLIVLPFKEDNVFFSLRLAS
jgi:hypothetical protein